MGVRHPRLSALLALLLLVPAPSIGTIMAMEILPGPIGQTIYGLCKLWLLAVPVVWTLLVDQNQLGWSRPRQGGLVTGAAVGIVLSAFILAGYGLVARRWIDPSHIRQMAEQNGIDSRSTYLAFAAYLVLINSLLEEYVWRWFVFKKTEVLFPNWPAVPIAALFFTIHHVVALRLQLNWTLTLLASAGVLAGGVILSWFYLRYRSIWPGYFSHAILDVVILAIGWRLIFG
jgi:membrane protease YdiL (CAAX protease family)